jgi:hypothetical protein
MRKIVFIFLSVLFLAIVSCHNPETEKDVNSVSYFIEKLSNKELVDSLSDRALNKGDTLAYANLKAIFYIGEQRSSGFLFYALVMSNKYNYCQAYVDVHQILNNNDIILDTTTKKISLNYLEKNKVKNCQP